MPPAIRRLFAVVALLFALPFAQAGKVENIILLNDYSDDNPEDQVAYTTDPKMGHWVGFDAFTGHQSGILYQGGALNWFWEVESDPVDTEFDVSREGTFGLGVDFNPVFAKIAVQESPVGSSYSYYAPPPADITAAKIGPVTQECEYTGYTKTAITEANLTTEIEFDGLAKSALPTDGNVGRQPDLLNTSYQTNIELKTTTSKFWGKLCDGEGSEDYVFTLADYRWGRQTTEFRVKGRCPGKYLLSYSVGAYEPIYSRYDYQVGPGGYWTWGSQIAMGARNGASLKRTQIEVTIGEDGWMEGDAIPLPIPPVPETETHPTGVGYELITRPEQAEAYGVDLHRDALNNPDPESWLNHAMTLEPVDCGCGGPSGGGDPGSGGPTLGSVHLDLNLGLLTGGGSAGRIVLRSPGVTSDLLTPAALKLIGSTASDWSSEVSAIEVSGVLRQIRTPQTFVDIVPTSATSYAIRFYPEDAGGSFDPAHPVATPAGTPHTVWTVGPGTVSGSVSITRAGSGSAGWEFRTLSDGSIELVRNGVSESHRRYSSGETIVEEGKTSDPVYGLASRYRRVWGMVDGALKEKENVQLGATGDILRGLVTDPISGGQIYRVGTHELYSRTDTDSIGSTSQFTSYQDGSSDYRSSVGGELGDLDADQKYEKLTSTTNISSPDQRTGYTHVIAYSAAFAHAGVNYKKEETRQAITPSSTSWDSSDKRTTTRWSFADGAHAGQTAWEFFPDGSATRWTYGTDAEGHTVTIQENGTPDAGTTAILYGTRSTRTEDAQGRLVASEERDIATNLVFASEEILERDPVHGTPTLTVRNAKEETRTYSTCCGRLETITFDGLVRTILYDGLDREAGEEVRSVSGTFVSGERNELDALGRVRKTFQRLGGTNERLVATADYDLAGNLTATWRLGGGAVTYSETVNSSGQWVKTTNRAESASGADDALEEVSITSGNGVPLEFWRNGVLITKWTYDSADVGRAVTEIKVGENDSESETVTSVYSMLGELVRVEYPYPEGAHSETEYDLAGRAKRQTDPDGVQTLFAYTRDADGEHVVTALDLNRDGQINYGASGTTADRITRTTTTYGTRDGLTVAKTLAEQWIEDGDTPRTVSVDERAVDGSRIWRTVLGTQTTQIVIAQDPQSGVRTETTTLPDQTRTIRTRLGDRVTSEVRQDASGGTVVSVTNQYDGYGRLWKVTDARGTTTLAYDAADRLYTVTTPDPGDGPQVTTYGHNDRGAVTSVTHPDTTTTHTRYWADGSVKRVWGSRAYPEYRTYDRQGRLKTLTTWQDYNPASHTGAGAAVTTWNYHSQRGWLENKRYEDGKGPSYTYKNAGRPFTRTWVRTVDGQPLVTTYGHNTAGELDSVDYSDSTPDVTHVFDRAGRPSVTTDAAGTLTRAYDPASLNLSGETYAGTGFLAGRSLTRGYDSRHRPQALATDGGYALDYGYDQAGRLGQVNQGFHSAVLGYEPGTSAHNKTTIKRVGVERVRHETIYDTVGRVDLVRSVVGGNNQVLRDYTLNAANQRTGVELEDGRRWAFGYDDIGQVTSAQKRLANNTTPLPGYSFGYTFDDIGNRTNTVTNGRSADYTPDLLNRYASRQVPGAADVRGEAQTGATVTVDGVAATHTGKDFYKAITAANGGGPVNAAVAVTATKAGPPVQTTAENRTAFVPQTPEAFVYDDDGNLTRDGRWDYTWDAENRLIAVETRADVVAQASSLPRQRLEFAYDSRGRRIRKIVKTWNASTSAFVLNSETKFLYDGWNLLTELDALNGNALVRSYAWGVDLSGRPQGAGGVGGLLWANTPTHTFAASADGNGNIVAYINTATLAAAGRADYGAFGEVVMQTGVAKELPFGFSTKYTDKESGSLYYGFRYYAPSIGRWLSRDPIGIKGGLNLFGMVENNPISYFDELGLELSDFKDPDWHHRLVQEFRSEFKSLGFDINAPEWGSFIEHDVHNKMSNAYSGAWRDFFSRNEGKNITPEMVTEELRAIEGRFNQVLRGAETATVRYGRAWRYARKAQGFIRVSGKAIGKCAQVITIVVVVQSYNELKAAGLSEQDALNGAAFEVVNLTPWSASEIIKMHKNASDWEATMESALQSATAGGNLLNGGLPNTIPGSRAYELNLFLNAQGWESKTNKP